MYYGTPTIKRQRTSIDLGTRTMYDSDATLHSISVDCRNVRGPNDHVPRCFGGKKSCFCAIILLLCPMPCPRLILPLVFFSVLTEQQRAANPYDSGSNRRLLYDTDSTLSNVLMKRPSVTMSAPCGMGCAPRKFPSPTCLQGYQSTSSAAKLDGQLANPRIQQRNTKYLQSPYVCTCLGTGKLGRLRLNNWSSRVEGGPRQTFGFFGRWKLSTEPSGCRILHGTNLISLTSNVNDAKAFSIGAMYLLRRCSD
jgi:hypothetical protein